MAEIAYFRVKELPHSFTLPAPFFSHVNMEDMGGGARYTISNSQTSWLYKGKSLPAYGLRVGAEGPAVSRIPTPSAVPLPPTPQGVGRPVAEPTDAHLFLPRLFKGRAGGEGGGGGGGGCARASTATVREPTSS